MHRSTRGKNQSETRLHRRFSSETLSKTRNQLNRIKELSAFPNKLLLFPGFHWRKFKIECAQLANTVTVLKYGAFSMVERETEKPYGRCKDLCRQKLA